MVNLDVIEKTEGTTPTTSPMVIVRKKGKIRVCLDPTDVNKNIVRRYHPLKNLDEISTQIRDSKFFTILDCKHGFWQIKVTDRTKKYLTMATPWGRYSYKRLPFGLASAPEVYQRLMSDLLEGCENTEVSMDDILIHASNKQLLNKLTKTVLRKLSEAGIKLNKTKCVFGKTKVKFLGHVLSSKGVQADPEKIQAISNLKKPENRTELQRLLGMATYLGKFVENLSEITQPMRQLLKKGHEWYWNETQEKSFKQLKEALSKTPVLRYYDPNLAVKLQVDASKTSIGAVLLQDDQPVAYASKSLSATQVQIPQIEKEAIAIKFGCEKFHELIFGKKLVIETDHKPLETIFKKPLQHAPVRLHKIMLQVLQYQPTVTYRKGKDIPVADTLSRDCLNPANTETEEEFEIHEILQMTESTITKIAEETKRDEHLQKVCKLITNGWPENVQEVPKDFRQYWTFREQLIHNKGILFKGPRVIIPKSLQRDMMLKVHEGHLGIEKTLNRAREQLFWINMAKDVKNLIETCSICQGYQPAQPKEPLIIKKIPELPWEIVAVDLFKFHNHEYILITDSYSAFFDFSRLNQSTSTEVILHLKKWFATHGIPVILESDNGPQFSSKEFKDFTKSWDIKHQTSSPKYPRSNGLAERYVQIAKALLKKCYKDQSDIYLALLNYRNTPRNNELSSPNQRLISRKTRTTLPVTKNQLKPRIITKVHDKLSETRNRNKIYADKATRSKQPFKPGQRVRIQQKSRDWVSGTVEKATDSPRSYFVRRDDGTLLRRNSNHLTTTKASITPDKDVVVDDTPTSPAADSNSSLTNANPSNTDPSRTQPETTTATNTPYMTRFGRTIKPVRRYQP